MSNPLLDIEAILTNEETPTLPVSPQEEAAAIGIVTAVFADPITAEIPETPGTLYASALGISKNLTGANLELAAKYFERLREAGRVEFAVLALKLAVAREGAHPAEKPEAGDQPQRIVHSQAFVELALGPIGRLLAGESE